MSCTFCMKVLDLFRHVGTQVELIGSFAVLSFVSLIVQANCSNFLKKETVGREVSVKVIKGKNPKRTVFYQTVER